ncbi:MAG: hypothetical protein AVDCRST_MAG59-2466 [uncultured Thermomicrobiales bacterium]|uniref:Uncharacterized protein n=1 Tax=uncultured Thermomicrobiales bacterium TaxID=1645740 RepID=A0A6J4UUJ5_9BACT|nr:MAG: hypothetical protein AVDCRST_MAG59-2466 [uncultured Thermomicrobiales bacterium]
MVRRLDLARRPLAVVASTPWMRDDPTIPSAPADSGWRLAEERGR